MTTRVRLINQLALCGERSATLELRGRLLMLTSVERYRAVTRAFDITGATYERKKNAAGLILLWWSGLAAILYLLYFFCYGLFMFNAIPAALLTAATGVVIARLLVIRGRVHRMPVVHIRLNITGTVYCLTIADTTPENPVLDTILSKMRPFDLCFHQYRAARHTYLDTDCLIAFPLHYIATRGALALGALVLSGLELITINFMIAHDIEPIRVKTSLLQAILWASIGLAIALRATWMYRGERKSPELQIALRTALGYVESGEFESAETLLREATRALPEDKTLLSLCAQIAVARGRCDEAEHFLDRLSTPGKARSSPLDTIRGLLQEDNAIVSERSLST